MNSSINVIVKKAAANKAKGTTFDVKYLKTQTNFEISFEKKDRASIDFPAIIAEDTDAMGYNGSEPIGEISMIVSGAGAIGKIINRSVRSLGRCGIEIEETDWDADGGLFVFKIENGMVSDLPGIMDLISRMAFRATTKFTNTHHPLTIYDLKQTCGLITDERDEVSSAIDTLTWLRIREEAILTELKEAKAAEKAAAKAKKAEEKKLADAAKKKAAAAEKAKAKKEKEAEKKAEKESKNG